MVADALSRLPDNPFEEVPDFDPDEVPCWQAWLASHPVASVQAALEISTDNHLLDSIIDVYATDDFCKKFMTGQKILPSICEINNLWYIGDHLLILQVGNIRKELFCLAHDCLGHFGSDKAYAALCDAYYWPNMRRDLEELYILSCEACLCNKSPTTKPHSPLHPLPIPDKQGDSVAIDFIGPLPEDSGFNCIAMFMDHLGSDICIVPTRTNLTAEKMAALFFDHWYCENGLPLKIVSNCDKLFISNFWKALHKLTGIKLTMSSSFHPQTDSLSERSNKTINQSICYHVNHQQHGWVKSLPRIQFSMMNMINALTGYSRFQLNMGRLPRLIPPLIPVSLAPSCPQEDINTAHVIEKLLDNTKSVKDNLLQSKISQASYANKHRKSIRF